MSYSTLSSQQNTFFYSVHTFTRIRQHYFSKYWWGPMHGPSSPPQIFWGPVPTVPLGLRPWVQNIVTYYFMDSLYIHRRRLWGQPGHVLPIIEKRPCICPFTDLSFVTFYHLLPPQYFGLPTQYF